MNKQTQAIGISLILILSSFCVTDLYAQEGEVSNPATIQFVPPTPNAASLGQYGEIPVSYYTGTPNISIPLYEVRGKDLSVPISLSYHASGIKVDQRPGMVGVGWSLNAGGVITRTIAGKKDEDSSNGYYSTNVSSKINQFISGSLTPAERNTFADNCARGLYDCEPDVYFYNFLGYSGKMVFDGAGNAMLIPHQKLKITGNVSTGFTITAEDGTVYVFQEIEYSEVTPVEGDINEGNTAWHLSSITSTTGDVITFSYTSHQIDYDLTVSETQKVPLNGCNGDIVPSASLTQYSATEKRISRIQSANTVVTLSENGIEIKDLADETTVLKEFDFQYLQLGPATDRPALSSVQEKSGLVVKPAYEFSYKIPSIPPAFGSYQQDHWGYYNSNSASTFLPEMWYGSTLYSGADREPDPDRTDAFILEEIVYPTGGKSVFNYENHTYGQITSNPVSEVIWKSRTQRLESYGEVETFPGILIEKPQTVSLRIGFDDPDGNGEPEEAAGEVIFGPHTYSISFTNSEGPDGGSQSYEFYITPGSYELKVEGFEIGVKVFGSVSYEEKTINTTPVNEFGTSGLRIVSIENYEDQNDLQPVSTKRYEYLDGSRSTGVLVNQPRYLNYRYTHKSYGGGSLIPVECSYFNRTSSSKATIASTNGSHVGYRKVTEYRDAQNAAGKTVYEYTNPDEFPDITTGIPITNTSYDYKRGALKRQIDYKYQNGEYLRTRQVENTYLYRSENMVTLPGVSVTYLLKDDYGSEQSEFYDTDYEHISQWTHLSSTKTSVYDEEGENPVVQTTTYTYDNADHLQMTAVTTTNSRGQSEVTSMKYAEDLSNSLLTDKHMHSQVLEQRRSRNGTDIRLTTTQFQSKSGFIVPVTFEDYPANGSNKTVVNYDYDNGNVVEVQKLNDVITSYIYGYNNALPIVKAVGVTHAELKTAYDLYKSNPTYETDLRDALPDALISTFTYDPVYGLKTVTDPNELVTTYEYDNLGRLYQVIDSNNDILQQIEYNYHQNND